MKRLFFIILLAVLPLQMSWAAVASYCQHEEGQAAQHFGHHAHKHQASSDTPDDKSNPAKVHNDCGFCHLSCIKAVLELPSQVMFSQGSGYIEPHPFIYSSHIPNGPERPDLRSAS